MFKIVFRLLLGLAKSYNMHDWLQFFLPHLPLFFTAIAISFDFAPAAKLDFNLLAILTG